MSKMFLDEDEIFILRSLMNQVLSSFNDCKNLFDEYQHYNFNSNLDNILREINDNINDLKDRINHVNSIGLIAKIPKDYFYS